MGIKSILKRSPLYPYWFARQNELPRLLNDSDLRYSDLYADFVGSGSLVFDVGANIGVRSKIFQHLGCRVVAIEPQRLCIAALRRNFGADIHIVASGVSDHEGAADLHCSDATVISSLSKDYIAATSRSGRFAGFDWNRTERIHLTTLDSLVGRFGVPDFIKIDIEGHELAALRGLSAAVPALSFEFTPEMREAGIACVDRLSTLGAYAFNFAAGETAILRFPDWLPHSEFISAITGLGSGDVYARSLIRSGVQQSDQLKNPDR